VIYRLIETVVKSEQEPSLTAKPADSLPPEYKSLLTEIQGRIRAARYEALKAVNRELIALYWDIGKMIVERQEREGWGQSVVERLAADVQRSFPGIRGFSAANFWRMRAFFREYRDKPNLAPLVREIAWAHNLVIMERCKDDLEREFYLRAARRFGWTKNVLNHQIDSQAYRRMLTSQTNFAETVSDAIQQQAYLAVRDEYTFDFLELGEEYSEKQLEAAILAKIEPFLLSMGGLFAFIGSQYRLEVGGQEFFIDLLLFHRGLRCLVPIELKIGDFQPEHVGKMQFYLTVLDEQARLTGENPAIGILICRMKNRTIVEYALRDANRPIGVAAYHTTRELPPELEGLLPAPEEIARLLNEL
jgi:predicted nuclease of restriction endonuclease-like (RecB) superfamily